MDKTKLTLGAGAATGLLGLLIMAILDPTHGDMSRLDVVAAIVRSAPRLGALAATTSYADDIGTMTQRPIFAMSTGPGAYPEKTFQLFGISISPNRKAALVSIDGAPAVWIRAGEVSGDVQLINVDSGHARFDTPLGERNVGLNDPAPTAAASSSAGG